MEVDFPHKRTLKRYQPIKSHFPRIRYGQKHYCNRFNTRLLLCLLARQRLRLYFEVCTSEQRERLLHAGFGVYEIELVLNE